MPAAGATKIACVGEQTTHSDQLSRSVEYPAMLQVQLGSQYNVQNFGDCCATVLYGYPKQGETHPYLSGEMGVSPLDANGMPVTPGYQFGISPSYVQSVPFSPDVVVIGSWGKHDNEIATSVYGGVLDPMQFQNDYERLVTTYLSLSNKPEVYVSTPVPTSAMATGPTTTVILPAIKAIAAKYNLPIVDLYSRFLNHPELYKDSTHVTDLGGLETISDTVYVALKGGAPPPPDQDGGVVDMDAADDVSGGGSGSSSGGTTGHDAGGFPRDDASTSSSGATGSSGGVGGSSSGAGGTPAAGNSASTTGCACAVATFEGGSGGAAAGVLSGAAIWLFVVRRRKGESRGGQ